MCFVLSLLDLATIASSSSHLSTPVCDQIDTLLFFAGWIFSSFFVLEALIKITAMGLAIYFRDRWNTFDFVIAIISLVVLIFDIGSAGGKTGHVDDPRD